jgi:hypothetical protein
VVGGNDTVALVVVLVPVVVVVISCRKRIRCWIHHWMVLVRVCRKGDTSSFDDIGGVDDGCCCRAVYNSVLQCCMVYVINCGVVIIPKTAHEI